MPNILLINPWIHDFAAYDFWAKPLGLLLLGAVLRKHGFSVFYIDCLDRFHPEGHVKDPFIRHGRGPYLKTHISTPESIRDIPRNFSRYGIHPEWFIKDLMSVPKPDLILVTSLMTYWYFGVQETINMIRRVFSDTPIILGGVYATLCKEHAQTCGADEVISGEGEKHILRLAATYTGVSSSPKFAPDNLDTYPYPAFDLQKIISYVPILTSRGCPFSCAYCASHILNPKRMVRSPDMIVEEIRFWHETYMVKDFVFYDDALLVDAQHHAIPFLEGIIKSGLKICFHTPNAVHIREITMQTADLMFKAGFKTLRLGLETTTYEQRNELDVKVTNEEFRRAVSCLKAAGFTKDQVGAYLLVGLPDQSLKSVEDSILTVKQTGITPVLAYYSPIPHTKLWERAKAASRYDLEKDPLFTNNAILPCGFKSFSWKIITDLKNFASC